jgi:hypothetical protein
MGQISGGSIRMSKWKDEKDKLQKGRPRTREKYFTTVHTNRELKKSIKITAQKINAQATHAGAPSDYASVNLAQLDILVRKGFTDFDLAKYYGVSTVTINNWKLKHPEFFNTIKGGKEFSDELVEKALYERARGYEHASEEIVYDKDRGRWVRTESVKKYAPSEVAAIFWLKNRQPEKWRDKREEDVNLKGEVEYGKLSNDERQKLANDITQRLRRLRKD